MMSRSGNQGSSLKSEPESLNASVSTRPYFASTASFSFSA